MATRCRYLLPLGSLLLLVLSACGGSGGGPDAIIAASVPGAAADDDSDQTPADGVLGSYLWHASLNAPGTYSSLVFGVDHPSNEVVTPVLTVLDIGEQHEFRRGTSAARDDWLLNLVDGEDEHLQGNFWPFPGGGLAFGPELMESQVLDRAPGLMGPDLIGAYITRVIIEVEQLEFAYASGRTFIDAVIRVTFRGYVLAGTPVGPGELPGGPGLDP